MQRRVRTSVVCLLGEGAEGALRDLGRDANVRAVLDDAAPPGAARAVATWSAAVRTHSPWFVHVDDPLADVADAWVADAADPAPLAVAVQDVVARWRAGTVELPDWYLVLADAAVGAPVPSARLALEVLADARPRRVAVCARGEERRTLRRLAGGRWWPDLPELLAGLHDRPPGLPLAPAPDGTAPRPLGA